MSWEVLNMKLKTSLFNCAVWKRNVVGGWYLWAALLLIYIMMLPVSVYDLIGAFQVRLHTRGAVSDDGECHG